MFLIIALLTCISSSTTLTAGAPNLIETGSNIFQLGKISLIVNDNINPTFQMGTGNDHS